MDCDPFPEENDIFRELAILKSQDEMAQILILNEIENDNQTNEKDESLFNLINLPHSHFHPH
ncbi:MAG: hypothetical protein K2Q34_06905 [Alphaproteobacteria bacterium]|nr:hypothetical protein [Alphaproteobacteria bacterium]